MTPMAAAKKRAVSVEKILKATEALAVKEGVSPADIENMKRPYGRGFDRDVNQLVHIAHVLNLAAFGADATSEAMPEPEAEQPTPEPTVEPGAIVIDAPSEQPTPEPEPEAEQPATRKGRK